MEVNYWHIAYVVLGVITLIVGYKLRERKWKYYGDFFMILYGLSVLATAIIFMT